MRTQYFKEYSPALGREMEWKVYGHGGRPMLYIPCQDGRFFDFEDFHMTDVWAPWIDAGQVCVFSIDTIDRETWSDTWGNAEYRSQLYENWIHYITDEMVPFMRKMVNEMNGWTGYPGHHCIRMQFGCSSRSESVFPQTGSVRRSSGTERCIQRRIRVWNLHERSGVPEFTSTLPV